ncbi:MAG: hypothetical protein MJ237_06680 [bacterium]|nr:hypothetical protein [bacterium]
MAEQNIEKVLNDKIAGTVIVSALKIWSKIEFISIVTLIIQFLMLFHLKSLCIYSKTVSILGLVLFFVIQYYVVRLYFDKLLFENIYKFENIENDSKKFDIIMSFFFKKNAQIRTMKSRWLGTIRLLKTTIIMLLLQILTMFLMFIFINFNTKL